MEEFFKSFAQSKIPSLLLMGTVLFIGAYIVVNSKNSQSVLVTGAVVILVGLVLAIFSFSDYRNREYVDAIIQHYKNALDNIGRTHSLFENKTQQTLKGNSDTVGAEEQSYSVEKDKGTITT
ncbi:hypothetical protein KKF69_08165 [Patescibacteria group bacterium]|nr:hypothetical protein [Patescibacteria group bacterium]